MNTWGRNFRLSIFGESHGSGIGIIIDGLLPGMELDLNFIDSEMKRRAPGMSDLTTSRAEPDKVEIMSGVFEGKTTGAPLCGMIRNKDVQSGDYNKSLTRPGHADYTAKIKYKGFADYRGGGHFSGRLTAALVFAGALAKLELNRRGVSVEASIVMIGGVSGDKAHEAILHAKAHGDSVGGIIFCQCNGLPPGLGEPFFCSAESVISSLLFSIPAVKGVEFGSGFEVATMTGSQANDDFFYDSDGNVRTRTNHNGGINGGITNGMPLTFRVAIKPTPSIAKEQNTVNLETGEDVTIKIGGRHDPCIVNRALPVIEAAAAISLLDIWV